MRESTALKNRVSVLFYYDGDDEYARPVRLMWRSREYELAPAKFWHITHSGGKLVHHYTVDDIEGELTFQLALETENLTWTLERCSTIASEAYEPAAPSRLIGAMA